MQISEQQLEQVAGMGGKKEHALYREEIHHLPIHQLLLLLRNTEIHERMYKRL